MWMYTFCEIQSMLSPNPATDKYYIHSGWRLDVFTLRVLCACFSVGIGIRQANIEHKHSA